MSAEPRGRRWAGTPHRPVQDYFDKLLAAMEADAPLDHHAASLRFDELACMRRALAVATAARGRTPAPPGFNPAAVHRDFRARDGGAGVGVCTAAVASILERSAALPFGAVRDTPRPVATSWTAAVDEPLYGLSAAPRSRGELALRRRAVWSDEGERAACELLGKWNYEFQRLIDGAAGQAGKSSLESANPEAVLPRSAYAASCTNGGARSDGSAAAACDGRAGAQLDAPPIEQACDDMFISRRNDAFSRLNEAERRGEAGWHSAWHAGDGDRPTVSATVERHLSRPAAAAMYLPEVMRPHDALRSAAPPSWAPPHVLPPQATHARASTLPGHERYTAGGSSVMRAVEAAAVAAHTPAFMPTTAAATAAVSRGASAAWPPQKRRRRWYKTVGVVMSKRGGRESHRFVDIANGVSEFHFGRTTTRYDGSLLVGPPVPAHGFEVHESVHGALSATFHPDARYLHVPRALLEVMVGGQPMVVDGRIFFVQLTPVRLLADPEKYAALHKELFGDEYYLPAPPLTVVADPAVPLRPSQRPSTAAACAARSNGTATASDANEIKPPPSPLSVAASALARAPWPTDEPPAPPEEAWPMVDLSASGQKSDAQ